MPKKIVEGFTLIELLVVVAIIGILAAVGVVAYNGYTAHAKYNAVKTNFKIISKSTTVLILDCELKGSMKLLVNGGGSRDHTCTSQNTNSFASLFIDHYHFSNFKNPLTGYSATWWFGTPAGASLKNKDGYILFDGKPTSNCLVKITSTVSNPSTKSIETLTESLSMKGLVSGC